MNDDVETIRPNYNEPDFDPAQIAPYTLEDPLIFLSGKKGTTPEQWEIRGKEILAIFGKEMFGKEPPVPEFIKIGLVEEKDVALAGGSLLAIPDVAQAGYKRSVSGFSGPAVPFYTKKARPMIFLNYDGSREAEIMRDSVLLKEKRISMRSVSDRIW